MIRAIEYRRKALRKLASLPPKERDRINDGIKKLLSDPYIGRRLEGQLEGLYRIRIGKRRIIYEILPTSEQEAIIVIRAIGPRGDVYK